jgi:hypothetical protein
MTHALSQRLDRTNRLKLQRKSPWESRNADGAARRKHDDEVDPEKYTEIPRGVKGLIEKKSSMATRHTRTIQRKDRQMSSISCLCKSLKPGMGQKAKEDDFETQKPA